MSNIYKIPLEQVQSVEWEGDGDLYDAKLYSLGAGHSEFIAFNPEFDWLYPLNICQPIKELKHRCFLWNYNGVWVAKYFTAQSNGNIHFTKLLLESNLNLTWESNPNLNKVSFTDDPRTKSLEDLYDLNYQMIWYLDNASSRSEDKIWALKCYLSDGLPIKDMGNVKAELPQLVWESNPNLNKVSFADDPRHKPLKDLYDLNYQMIWYLDDEANPTKDKIWALKCYLNNDLPIKDMGNVKAELPFQLDVIFISYNEPEAEKNWRRVLSKFPLAKRVNGVDGIINAHKAAATLSTTDMFYVVDGDAYLEDNWTFNFQPSIFDRDCVYVWTSINPINGLAYGYGGVKLIPRELMLSLDSNQLDMTTNISKKFKSMEQVSNTTAFNTDKFTTWRSAFRECVKLATKENSPAAEHRLAIWCSAGKDKQYGEWAIKGAISGRNFGIENKNDEETLQLINNYDWLYARFKSEQLTNN